MEFKIDYGSVALPTKSPAPPAGPLFASVDGRVSPLSNGEVVFLDLHTEQLHVMTEQVLGAMDLCRPFRTLDEHVQGLQQAMPALQQQGEAVKRVLESLVQRGLLLSDTDYLKRLGRVQAAAPAPFSALFVRACDRPAQLRRLLDSLLDYERRSGAKRRYVVLDDSRETASVREQQRLVAEFAAAAGVEARHVGGEAWNRAAAWLGREAGAGASADWLLQRAPERRAHGGGLGWNLATLLAAGTRHALLDDDFLFPLRMHPEVDGRVDLGASGPIPARFFDSLDAALDAGRERDGDPLQDHLDLCGAPLGAALGRHALLQLRPADLRGLAPSALPHLARGERIIATVNGHRGHSGASTSGWLFALDERSRESLWSERERYLRQIDSPTVWYGPSRTRLQAQGNFTPFMLDGGTLLPYTSPAGRSEDLLFAGLCRLVAPHALTAHLPTAVGHRQEHERRRAGSLREAFTPGLNAYLADLALSTAGELHAEDPARRLHGFAARLRDLAEASDASIAGELREHLAYARSTLIQHLQAVLQAAPSSPVYWQADLRQLIEAQGKALTQAGPPRLADWVQEADTAAVARAYRAALAEHAAALEAWPALWQLAATRREALWQQLG
jgi:hypothetical protein